MAGSGGGGPYICGLGDAVARRGRRAKVRAALNISTGGRGVGKLGEEGYPSETSAFE